MLKSILQIGKNVDWEPDVLRKLQPLIDMTREQLSNKGKSQPTQRRDN